MGASTVMLRWTNRVEVAMVRRFGWSVGSRVLGVPVAVLETTGARTGQARSSIVAWAAGGDDVEPGESAPGDGDAGRIIVGGGAGGRSQVPDWVANLRANPSLRVTIDADSYPAVAREPGGPERAMARERLLGVWPRAASYERRSGRRLPIFMIERLGPVDRVDRVGRVDQ